MCDYTWHMGIWVPVEGGAPSVVHLFDRRSCRNASGSRRTRNKKKRRGRAAQVLWIGPLLMWAMMPHPMMMMMTRRARSRSGVYSKNKINDSSL